MSQKRGGKGKPSTDITKEHYENPKVKEIIMKFAVGNGTFRAINGNFNRWYRYDNSGNARLLNFGDDYSFVTGLDRTLYVTLNHFDESLKVVWRPKVEITADDPLGTPADTAFYSPACDIDVCEGYDIDTPEIKTAIEKGTQFLVDYLEDNGVHESVWAAFSGGGAYVYVHHRICMPRDAADRQWFFEEVTDRFNRLIEHVSAEFFKAHPEYVGKIKFDALNNSKRVFKCILSLHKRKPYAVTPLNRDHIQIDLERARVPLKDDMLAEAEAWYATFDPAERGALLKLLDTFKEAEDERERSHRQFKEIWVCPTKVDDKFFPPCMARIIKTKNTGAGKTRFSGVLSAFLYQMGWPESEAWDLVRKVSDRNGVGNAQHIFGSCFGRINCPSCQTIQTDGAGYPHLGLKGLGACKPQEECGLWPGTYAMAQAAGDMLYEAIVDATAISEEEASKYVIPSNPRFSLKLEPDNFLSQYIAFGNEMSDAYRDFWFMGGTEMLAIINDGRTYVNIRVGRVYANVYNNMIGASSTSHKSTIMTNVHRTLGRLGLGGREVATDGSPEGWLEGMSESPHAYGNQDESGNFLKRMHTRDYMAGMTDMLNKCFDGTSFSKKNTRKSKKTPSHWVVNQPYYCQLYATTPSTFSNSTTADDIYSGFWVRFLHAYPNHEMDRFTPLDEASPGLDALEDAVVERLKKIQVEMDSGGSPWVKVTLEPEGWKYFAAWQTAWHKKTKRNHDDFMGQLLSRYTIYVIKMGMLFTMGRSDFKKDMPISTAYIVEACRLVDEYFIPHALAVRDLIGEGSAKDTNLIHKIEGILRVNGGRLTHRELLRKVKVVVKQLDEALNTMTASGTVEMVAVKNRRGRATITVFLLDHNVELSQDEGQNENRDGEDKSKKVGGDGMEGSTIQQTTTVEHIYSDSDPYCHTVPDGSVDVNSAILESYLESTPKNGDNKESDSSATTPQMTKSDTMKPTTGDAVNSVTSGDDMKPTSDGKSKVIPFRGDPRFPGAILNGTKTETRRPPQWVKRNLGKISPGDIFYTDFGARLRILDVHNERIGDITEAGIKAEGCNDLADFQAVGRRIHPSWTPDHIATVLRFELVKDEDKPADDPGFQKFHEARLSHICEICGHQSNFPLRKWWYDGANHYACTTCQMGPVPTQPQQERQIVDEAQTTLEAGT